jgi:hypothetical protein
MSSLQPDQRTRINQLMRICQEQLNGKLEFETYQNQGNLCFKNIRCRENGNGGYSDIGQQLENICINNDQIWNVINNNCGGRPCDGGTTTTVTTGGSNGGNGGSSGICIYGACQNGVVQGTGQFFTVGPLDIKVYPGSRCYKNCSRYQRKGKKRHLRRCLKCTYGRKLGKCLYKTIRKNRSSCLARYSQHLSLNQDWVSHSTSFSCTYNQSGCPNQSEVYNRLYQYHLGDDCDGDCDTEHDGRRRRRRDRRGGGGGTFWPSFFGAAAHLGGTFLTTRSNERVAENCRLYYEYRLDHQSAAELPMDDPDVYNCNNTSTHLFAGLGAHLGNGFGNFGSPFSTAGFTPGFTRAYNGHHQGLSYLDPYYGLNNLLPQVNVNHGGGGGFQFNNFGQTYYQQGPYNSPNAQAWGNQYQYNNNWHAGAQGAVNYPYYNRGPGSYWNNGVSPQVQQLQFDSKARDAAYYNNSLVGGGGYNQIPFMNYNQQYYSPFGDV